MIEKNRGIGGIKQEEAMRKHKVKDLLPDHFFSEPVFLDEKFILAASEVPVTGAMIRALEEWRFDEVYSNGAMKREHSAKGLNQSYNEDLINDSILTDRDKMMQAEEFYAAFFTYIETVFTQVTQENELDFKSMTEKMKSVCDIVRENKVFLLRVRDHNFSSPSYNYLVSHTARSTVISIIIGLQLQLPLQSLVELGIAALLHEIGMIKLPPKVYLSKRFHLPQEQKVISAHPMLGYEMLSAFDLPMAISLAALEHHERENGSGYPRNLLGKKISSYAKIIAVACSYEALSAQRPHKEAKEGHIGMLELLKNKGKQYDDAVVRALVFSLSIYPIGSYVLLSNGRMGQVVDVNPNTPLFPIVQVFGGNIPDGNKKLETSKKGISIIRPLTKKEIEQE